MPDSILDREKRRRITKWRENFCILTRRRKEINEGNGYKKGNKREQKGR
jgi:hypothetical protein